MSKGRKKKGNNNINPIVHEQSINASDEDKERNEILDKLKTMRTLDHSPKNITPNIKKIEKLLSKRMKIYITDGRIIIGDFECLDNEGNIILTGTSQYYSEPRDDEPGRGMSCILIPQQYIKSIKVLLSEEERKEIITSN